MKWVSLWQREISFWFLLALKKRQIIEVRDAIMNRSIGVMIADMESAVIQDLEDRILRYTSSLQRAATAASEIDWWVIRYILIAWRPTSCHSVGLNLSFFFILFETVTKASNSSAVCLDTLLGVSRSAWSAEPVWYGHVPMLIASIISLTRCIVAAFITLTSQCANLIILYRPRFHEIIN